MTQPKVDENQQISTHIHNNEITAPSVELSTRTSVFVDKYVDNSAFSRKIFEKSVFCVDLRCFYFFHINIRSVQR